MSFPCLGARMFRMAPEYRDIGFSFVYSFRNLLAFFAPAEEAWFIYSCSRQLHCIQIDGIRVPSPEPDTDVLSPRSIYEMIEMRCENGMVERRGLCHRREKRCKMKNRRVVPEPNPTPWGS
jgi:hypothetical protein